MSTTVITTEHCAIQVRTFPSGAIRVQVGHIRFGEFDPVAVGDTDEDVRVRLDTDDWGAPLLTVEAAPCEECDRHPDDCTC